MPTAGRKKPLPDLPGRGLVWRDYFLAPQAQPQPEDFFSSCFCMVPASVQAGHFLGLHLPSFVAPHFSHLNTAILISFTYVDYFRGAAPQLLSPVKGGAQTISAFVYDRKNASVQLQKIISTEIYCARFLIANFEDIVCRIVSFGVYAYSCSTRKQ